MTARSFTCVVLLLCSTVRLDAGAADPVEESGLLSIRVDPPPGLAGLHEALTRRPSMPYAVLSTPDGAARAELRAMHTDEALYLSIASTSEGGQTDARLDRDDPSIFTRERIELVLGPDPDAQESYLLAVDVHGSLYDARHEPGAKDPLAAEWQGAWEAATRTLPNGWTADIRLPFAVFGVETPQTGAIFRLKCSHVPATGEAADWPHNPFSQRLGPDTHGTLHFERINLIDGGDFAAGEPDIGAPAPWSATLTSAEVDNAEQGTVETLDGAGSAPGRRALRLTKLATALYWPQVWYPALRLEPGAAYEFSIRARGDLPQVNLRANANIDRQTIKMSRTFDTPAEWERLRYTFVVPSQATSVSVGISAPSGISGEVFLEDALLRRVSLASGGDQVTPALSHEPDPDPVQGLDTLMSRQGHKPWELYRRDDALMTRRTVFHDRALGTQVWMLDDSPTVDHCSTASVWPAWNADASLLYLEGPRVTPDGLHHGWFMTADGARLIPHRASERPIWDREDPDVYFMHREGRLVEGNARTGATRVVAEWTPHERERVYGLTRDNRYIFLDTPNGGIWVSYEPGDTPIPPLGLHDGRPEAPGKLETSGTYGDTVLIADRHSTTVTQEWGPLYRIRVGTLIDRETGAMERVIVPLCGHTEYLRTFISDRVRFPEGPEWDTVRKHDSDDLEELFRIYRYYPTMTHGHETPSPDGEYFGKDGGYVRLIRLRDGETTRFRLSPNGGNYHLHWGNDFRFMVGWVRGWEFGNCLRPLNANIEYQIFSDATAQPIVDTKHRFNGYYSGGDFAMLSPDVTKIHYGSSMTGRFRNYIAVMARPRPPRRVSARPDGAGAVLRWDPPRHHRETAGYLVYRSDSSGDGYALLTPEPVKDLEWRDDSRPSDTPCFYVVTSIEGSGLESGYSMEAFCPPITAGALPPLVVYVEAEEALRDLYTDERPGLAMGVDRPQASDWYYVYRHPEAAEGRSTLTIHLPATADYHVWARVRNVWPGAAGWNLALPGASLEVVTRRADWTWVRAEPGPVRLEQGESQVILSTASDATQMDLICLATDPAFVPEGARPEDAVPPARPTGMVAENVLERANRLTWQQVSDPDLAHYNVYAAEDPDTQWGQEQLVGSVVHEEFIDWGLRAGRLYHYAVTAVDRRGNESAPALAQAATPPAAAPETAIVLAFADARLDGPFERATAAGARAEAFVVPEDPAANRVTWEVDVPHAGGYYFWLRYLHRGSGSRGGEVTQDIRVLLNGKPITTLGGGATDLHVPDRLLVEGNPLAERMWTWAWPGVADLERVELPAGRHQLTLTRLAPDVRYDVLLLTNEPAFVPSDGRLRQR